MSTGFNHHPGPHTQIQGLLHEAAANGATKASVDIHGKQVEYTDNRKLQ